MFEIYLHTARFPPFIVSIAPALIAVLLGIVVLATFWRSSLSFAVVLMGVACVCGGIFVMPYALSHGLSSVAKLTSYSSYMFSIGIGSLILSLIIVYKPTWLYAKNRPRDERPPPVWSKEMADKEILVPLRALLSENERFILSNYNYVMVSINGIKHLVPPNELVPRDSVVLRDNGYFIGLRKVFFF